MLLLVAACAHAPPAPPTPASVVAPEAEARAFYLRAEAAAARGDVGEAVRAAFWIPRLDGRDPWAWVRAADLHLRAGRAEAAAEAATLALALSDLPEAHRVVGLAALARGMPAVAFPHLERAAGLPGVEGARVRALAELGRQREAEAAWEAWQPADPPTRLERARTAHALGWDVPALAAALTVVDDPVLGPEAARVALAAGRASCHLGELHAAVRDEPADARWAPVLAEVAEAAGDADLAARVERRDPDPAPYAARIARIDPEAALAWLGDAPAPAARGTALAALGRLDEAVAAWSVLAPVDAAALEAEALLAGERPQDALARTEAVASEVACLRARALAASGRGAEAVAAAAGEPACELRVRSLLGDDAGALAVAHRMLALDPCSPEPLARVAAARPACEATELWATLADVRPADPDVAARLSVARSECGGSP